MSIEKHTGGGNVGGIVPWWFLITKYRY